MSEEDRLWGALGERLDRAEAAGGAAFWLRDDDAVAPTARLDRLIAIAADHAVPLALAVIPAKAQPALAERLAGEAGVTVLQHGFAHDDHSAPGSKKCELGSDRPIEAMLAELESGRERLSIFPNVAPMLVPPWNRIAPALVRHLPSIGTRALSTFGARASSHGAAGLLVVNTHVDPVDWRSTRGFVGGPACLRALILRLDAVLSGAVDAEEPTGLLTHHLVHDAETLAFLAQLLDFTAKHGGARWLSASTLLGHSGNTGSGDGAA
ncbi:MAG: polysaccharide deacetylase family protein [Rhizobiaceae bacterium]|nr:polysaccharide deacetylase family protein [Rhizobiaceae bacterium]